MGKTRRRKQDQSESTAHLEPHVFTDQAEAEAAAEAHAQARCDVWEYDAEGQPTGWVVRIERRLASYYLHEDGGFIR